MFSISEIRKGLKWLLDFAISQWFIIGMGVVVALAHSFPNVARSGGVIRSEYSISYGAVALIFLLSGLSISTGTLKRMAFHWRAHLITQSLSFLVTPTVIFAFTEAIRAAHNPSIDPYVLIGMIITGSTPTTVSSNVVMTKQANANDSLSLVEVSIGNILGAFISPALVQMFLSSGTGFAYGNPALGSSLTSLYGHVMKQLGLSLFLPLFVGQVVQNIFPNTVKKYYTKFKLSKVGTFCLLLLVWATFSTAFYQNAFNIISTETVIMIVFFNIGIYLFFTIICFIFARPPILGFFKTPPDPETTSKTYRFFYKLLVPFYFDRKDTIAIMLCGAAKTVALGVPLITAQYGHDSPLVGRVSIPLVLYQGEQILTAQCLIPFFKKWIANEERALEPEFVSTNDPELASTTIITDEEKKTTSRDNSADGGVLEASEESKEI